MGKARRKKGKNARMSRQGQLGITKSQFKKSDENSQNFVKELEKMPYIFIFHFGEVGKYVRRLERDIRRVFQPYTSMDLRVTKKNNFKDFLVNSQFLGVSHLVVLTKTDQSLNLRIIRNPQGPTIYFKESYSLNRDIQSAQKRPINFKEMFLNPPLVILNGFTQANGKHLNLIQSTIQNMFPSIDIDKVRLSNVRRALLVSYDSETETISFRHYSIKATPSGISKPTKKLMQNKVPDLSNPGALSESEVEFEQEEVELPQEINPRGLTKGQSTKLRLVEIGPRMTWKLTKIEEDINDGEVLYHSYIKKSVEEICQLRKKAPKMHKKKLLMEKNIEHASIRKLKNHAENEEYQNEKFNAKHKKLIQRQAEVTGDEPMEE